MAIWISMLLRFMRWMWSVLARSCWKCTFRWSTTVRIHPTKYVLSMYAKFPEKLTLLTPWYAHVHTYVRNYSFSENFAYQLMDDRFARSNVKMIIIIMILMHFQSQPIFAGWYMDSAVSIVPSRVGPHTQLHS